MWAGSEREGREKIGDVDEQLAEALHLAVEAIVAAGEIKGLKNGL